MLVATLKGDATDRAVRSILISFTPNPPFIFAIHFKVFSSRKSSICSVFISSPSNLSDTAPIFLHSQGPDSFVLNSISENTAILGTCLGSIRVEDEDDGEVTLKLPLSIKGLETTGTVSFLVFLEVKANNSSSSSSESSAAGLLFLGFKATRGATRVALATRGLVPFEAIDKALVLDSSRTGDFLGAWISLACVFFLRPWKLKVTSSSLSTL